MTPTEQEQPPDYLLKAVQGKIDAAQQRSDELSRTPSPQIGEAEHGGPVHVAASKEMGV